MIARFSASALLAACFAWPSLASADDKPQPEQPSVAQERMPAPLVPGFLNQWKSLVNRAAQPETLHEEKSVESVIRAQSPGGVQLAGGYYPQSGVDSYGDGSGFEVYRPRALPWERDGDSPLRKFITEVLPNNYFRIEYLNYNIDDVGAQAVGADNNLIRQTGLANVREQRYQAGAFFIPVGQDPGMLTSQTLLVNNTEPLNFNRISGIRATYGIPLTFGRVEFSGFALEQNEATLRDLSFGPRSSIRQLVIDEPATTPFILDTDLNVANLVAAPGTPAGAPVLTNTPGTVLAVGQPLGPGLLPNIPAGSLVPATAPFDPPGIPPLSIPPRPIGTQTRPLIDLDFGTTGFDTPPPFPVFPVVLNNTLPNGAAINSPAVGVPPQPLTPIFVVDNVPAGPFTFDTNYAALGQANSAQLGQFVGPFFIAAPAPPGTRAPRPNPLNPLRLPVNLTANGLPEVIGMPNASVPNVIDPNRVPTAEFPNRFPGGDAIIFAPAGGQLFPTVNVLLEGEISPGIQPSYLLPAGTLLRVIETGIPSIPLLQNGQVGSTFLIYDQGYGADHHTDVWGTEAKLILDIGPNHNGLTINPLVGFRYMSFDEQFRQVGLSTIPALTVSQSNSVLVTPEPLRASVIDSEAENDLFGLQVGASAEYNNKWITLGAEPRVSLGVNHYEAEVNTSQLRSVFDPNVTTRESETTFAPVFDTSFYGQVHLTPYFSLHASYNYTYLFQVSRPVDNILYNDNGPTAPPGVVVDAETNDMHIQGISLGGEFRFRDLKFR